MITFINLDIKHHHSFCFVEVCTSQLWSRQIFELCAHEIAFCQFGSQLLFLCAGKSFFHNLKLEESWYWGWTFIMQTGLLSNKGIAIIGWWNGAVQHECIPQAILGMDVICQAKSGMGKTAVFVLSTLQQIEPVTGQVAALVLCHTRELAYQVDHSFCIAELVCQDEISPSRFTVTCWVCDPCFHCPPLTHFLKRLADIEVLTDQNLCAVDLPWVWEVQHLPSWHQGGSVLWWCEHQDPQGPVEEWVPSYCGRHTWPNSGVD